MGSMQMKSFGKIFGISIYYADSNFMYRGFYIWTGKTNYRFIAFNKFSNWSAKDLDD